ncbi:protein LONGIFOLIA 1-like, partial [Nicotiana tomentosiformis]|uniref:protein LONGIFOLIA 1-like n=1 Tax=Nicotiana tomentosiformis TaxID=4098 RepID=UPI00388CBAF9
LIFVQLIQVGIQIRTSIDSRSPRVSTSTSRGKTDDFSSECSSSSPAPKTPTLVARLMGLDLLPENNSTLSNISTCNNTPTSRSHSKSLLVQKQVHDLNIITGTVSLPETPRVSSESWRSDVEYHHRLSLQINKENIGEESQGLAYKYNAKKMARRRRDDKLKQVDDENRSPGYYARQIVKQVKERVSRKVGHDITNSVTSKDDNVFLRNNNNNYASGPNSTVVLLKPTKKAKALNHLGDDNSLISKQSTPSSSPRLRFLDTKNKLLVTTTSTGNKTQTQQHSPRLSPLSPSAAKIITNHKSQDSLWEEMKQNQQLHQRSTKKGKGERYEKPPSKANSDPIRRKKEEQFVHSAATNKGNSKDKKCKKTALSNVPTFFPLKKEPSSPPTKLLIKKSQESDAHPLKRSTQLSCSSSHSYNTRLQESNRCNGATTTTISSVGREEFQYIQRILKRAGIDKGTPVSFAKWYSQSHPLDPSIFHHLELFHPSIFTVPRSSLSQRCNRKLIFQLVDELLVEILEPYYINLNPKWLITPKIRRLHCRQMCGLELIETLCTRIQSFPSANCQVLEDIDALIDKDLQKRELGTRGAFEEEGESIILEIERDIFELLLHESVAVFGMARWYRITR